MATGLVNVDSAEPVTGPNEEEACRHQGRPTHDQSLDRREIAQEDDQSVTPGRWHQAQEHHRGNGYRHRIVVESFLRTSPAYTHIETSPEVHRVVRLVGLAMDCSRSSLARWIYYIAYEITVVGKVAAYTGRRASVYEFTSPWARHFPGIKDTSPGCKFQKEFARRSVFDARKVRCKWSDLSHNPPICDRKCPKSSAPQGNEHLKS